MIQLSALSCMSDAHLTSEIKTPKAAFKYWPISTTLLINYYIHEDSFMQS